MTLADAKAAKLAGKATIRRDRTVKARSEQVGEASAADGPATSESGSTGSRTSGRKPAKPKPRKRTKKKKT